MDRLTPPPCRPVVKVMTASLVLVIGIALGCGPKNQEPQEEPTAPDQPDEAGAITYLKRKGASFQREDENTLKMPVEPYWTASVGRWDRVTDADLRWLQQIGTLKQLGITDSTITDQGLAAVAGLARLESLSLNNLPGISDAGIDRLTDLGTLQRLRLQKLPISDAALKRFGRLRKMKWLTLEKVRVTGAGFAALAGLKQLEELNLSGSPVEDAGCAELARLPALKILSLTGTHVGNEGVRLLSQSKSLERLTLERTRISDEALRHIPAFPRLSGLGLSNTAITDAGLAHLRTSKLTGMSLRIIRNDGITDQGLRHLGQIKTLKGLTFDPEGTGATEEGIRALRRALPDLEIRRWRRLEK